LNPRRIRQHAAGSKIAAVRGQMDQIDCEPGDFGALSSEGLHSSLAVTTDSLPLGLAAIKLWTRKKFKGTNALKGKGLTAANTR
jgi:hypothetical protein